MEPNFHDGEYLLTDKISYRFGEPKRGDVIIFHAPGENGDDFIKRIIGLPGEKVSLANGKVLINGKEINEPYIPSSFGTFGNNFLKENEVVTVPSNQYFVLGDNRGHSADSRAFGFVEKSKIIGRAWFLYWPITKLGIIGAVEY